MTKFLYVLCINPGPRIRYVFDHIRIQWNLKDVIFFSSKDEEPVRSDQVLNYSAETYPNFPVQIIPSGLMDSGSIHDPAEVQWIEGLPYFFKTNVSEIGPASFDILSMIFFMLSRMEEYSDGSPDDLGRIQGKNSFAAAQNFLQLPVVDLWLQKLYTLIFKEDFVNTIRATPKLTVDIDIAWAFAHRPVWELLAGAVKELIYGKWNRLGHRFRSWFNPATDPFDRYNYFNQIHLKYGGLIYFILLSDRSKLDRNYNWQHRKFLALVKNLSLKATVGLHPGSLSFKDSQALKIEKQRLDMITGENTVHSRQHYLLLRWPGTYRALLSEGLLHDHSMGYHDLPGFRAGTALAFNWYDLEQEEKSNLKIHPFFVMDVTLKQYLKMSASMAAKWMEEKKLEFEKWNLPMVLIWHNSSFYEADGWKDWEGVLEEIFSI